MAQCVFLLLQNPPLLSSKMHHIEPLPLCCMMQNNTTLIRHAESQPMIITPFWGPVRESNVVRVRPQAGDVVAAKATAMLIEYANKTS